jgi:MoxR-like ATPase
MQTQPEFLKLREHMQKVIVGQHTLIDRIMIGVLTGGHLLLEGPPGLAKTTAVKTLATGIHASFQRIQFTPDLMPSDITGSDVFDPNKVDFRFIEGPLFHEIILADEINRAPPKVQSALLEAMEELQVTVGGRTHKLPGLFIVMATQNPLEQSGTYPLPEAQLDRFLLHVILDYPSEEEEFHILQRDRLSHFGEDAKPLDTRISPETVLQARREVAEVHVEEVLDRYAVTIVNGTRQLEKWCEDWEGYIEVGASPRATLALVRAASAHAYLAGRDYVIPDDVQEVAADILRHRLTLSLTARASKVSRDDIINRLLEKIPVP